MGQQNPLSTKQGNANISIYRLQNENIAWHEEHDHWLTELKEWQRDQDRLDALFYRMEATLSEEERRFEELLESIEELEKLLRTHEISIKNFMDSDEHEEKSLQKIIKEHELQEERQRSIHKLKIQLQNNHKKTLISLMSLIRHKILPMKPIRAVKEPTLMPDNNYQVKKKTPEKIKKSKELT